MTETVYIVDLTDVRGADEPEFWLFDDRGVAEEYAAVRGGCSVEAVYVLGEHDAKPLIDAEAKARRDEERFERYRQEGW